MTKTLKNPFYFGGAILNTNGTGFVGRDEILKNVISSLNAQVRIPIIVYGQRRMGKSSLLRQLPYKTKSYHTVYFDLQGKGSMNLDMVLYGLGREISKKIEIDRPKEEDTTSDNFIPIFIEKVRNRLEGNIENLILLIDEFDVVDDKVYGTNVAAFRFVDFLRKLSEDEPQIGIVLVIGRKIEELSSEVNSGLLKGSMLIPIAKLTLEQVYKLIMDLSSETIIFENLAIEAIFSLTKGHPYCTQLLCNTVWSMYVSEDVSLPITITKNNIKNAIKLSLERGSAGLNWIYDGLSNPVHRLILSAMANLIDQHKKSFTTLDEIRKLLSKNHIFINSYELEVAPKDLQRWDVIEMIEGRMVFSVPLIGLWIKQERSIEKLRSEVYLIKPEAYNYFELARKSLEDGDEDQAISNFRGAIKSYPEYIDALKGLSNTLAKRNNVKDLEEAVKNAEKVLELDSEASTKILTEPIMALLSNKDLSYERIAYYYDIIVKLENKKELNKAKMELHNRAILFYENQQFNNTRKIASILNISDLELKAKRKYIEVIISNSFSVLLLIVSFLLAVLKIGDTILQRFLIFSTLASSIGSLFVNTRSRYNIDREFNIRLFFNKLTIIHTLLRLVLLISLGFITGYSLFLLTDWKVISIIVIFIVSIYSFMFGLTDLISKLFEPSKKMKLKK